MALQLRRGTNAQRLGLTPVEGEMIYVTDNVLVTISVTSIDIGSDLLTTSVEHGLSINQQIKYTGATLNGLTKDQVYYVKTTPLTTTFTLSTSLGGGTLNISGTYTVPLVFAKTPCLASGAPVGTDVSPLWAGDGITVGGNPSGAILLDELRDVVITQPVAEGDFLWYDGTNWINENETSVDTRAKTLSLTRRYTTAVTEYESNVAQRLNARVTDATNDNTDDAGPALRFERSSGTEYTKTYVSGGAIGAFTVTLNNVTSLVVGNKVTGTGLPSGNGALITVIAGNQLTLDTAFTVQASGTYTIGESVGFGQLAFEYFGTTDLHKFKVSTSTDNYLESPADQYPGTYVLIESTKNSTNINQGRLFIDDVNDRVGVNTTSPEVALHVVGTERSLFQLNNTDLGPNSAILVRKNYTNVGNTGAYTTGDGASVAFQLDSDTQAVSQVALIDAVYDATASPNKNSSIRLRTNTVDVSTGPFTTVANFTPVLATLPGGLDVNSGVLFVDATNNRVGINNSTPNFALDISGEAYISGDLTVAGGDITTSASVGNLFNTTATTINIGNGATTEVNVGCPTGGSRVFIKAPILDVSGTANITTALTTPSITTLSSADLLISPNTGADLKLQTNLAADPVIANRITANTSTSTRTLVTRVESTGTPAVGLGNIISMETETVANTFGVSGYLETISTAATAGVLDTFRMNFGVMNTVGGVTTTVPRMTLEGNGDLQIDGDLTVSGNEIKSSGGTTAITLSGANISSTGSATFGVIDINTTIGQIDTNSGSDLTLDSDGGDVIVNDRLTVNVTLQTPSEDTTTTGNINIGTAVTEFTTGASGETSTLPSANIGQFKTLVRTTTGAGAMVVTVTNAGWKGGASGTITFGNQGDSCFLQYLNDGRWYILGSYDVVIA